MAIFLFFSGFYLKTEGGKGRGVDKIINCVIITYAHGKCSKIMKSTEKLEQAEFLYQVARLYYEEGLTQEQIARQISLSRQKIQRLLDSARKEGIVQIQLISPVSSRREIEKKLEKHFKLTRAIVVSSSIKAESIIRKNIGRAAAAYLEDTLRDNDIVGIGWGRTVYETLNYFKPTGKIFITAVPLIGGIGQMAADFQVNELTRKFAEKTGGIFTPFHAPALVDNEKIVRTLFSDKNVGKVARLWEKVNIAIIGIGGPLSSSSYVPTSYYSEADITLLEKEGHTGDILSHFLDKDGKSCSPLLSKKVVGISLEQLKEIERVIGVAGSVRKKEAILAALRGRYIDVLITDENVAVKVLKI
jgi:DNA-binding transcriptional regulator LsrR (DeoR family)